ncbi:MAG TPA: helix-turn-helix transcriptional regulator [Clostridiaceae bacterium]|nr:helix-turn-helix transcriptional regulator [Clostridiaceae bacterium]
MYSTATVKDKSLFKEELSKSISTNKFDKVYYEIQDELESFKGFSKFNPDIAFMDNSIPVIDDAKSGIEDRESGIEELKNQVTFIKPLLKEMVLSNLLCGVRIFANEVFKNLGNTFRVDLDTKLYQTVVIELCEKQGYRWSEDEKQMWSFAVLNVVNEIFNGALNFESCRDNCGRICVIANVKQDGKEDNTDLLDICERISVFVKKYLKLSPYIGVSEVHIGNKFLAKSYNEALQALKDSILSAGNNIVRYENINTTEKNLTGIFAIEQKRRLLMATRMNNINEVNRIIHSVFEDIRHSDISIDYIVIKCSEIASTCFEFLAETDRDIKSVFGDDFYILKEIMKRKTIEEMEELIKEIFLKAMSTGYSKAEICFSKAVTDAQKYIEENYSNPNLKIDQIAKSVYVGRSYLCVLFKKEMGKTINNFITEIRMNKAKKLIEEGHDNVSDISVMVGYADANYFGKCFKKTFGITPGRYIEEISCLKKFG